MFSRQRHGPGGAPPFRYDPLRERRAELRARRLMGTVVSRREMAMYEELGFIAVVGSQGPGYGYLLYPHGPIVSYDLDSSVLLSEYCVGFPDRCASEDGERLPDADDVLAKWMALHGSERELISVANVHLPGRQLDPERVRRDLARLRGWAPGGASAMPPLRMGESEGVVA